MEQISIDKINVNDRTFCISYPLCDDALLASIRKVGIVQPVVLLDTTPFVILTGFRRIEAAISLKLGEVPFVLTHVNEKDGLLHGIHDNLKRGLNLVEKAYALERMLQSGFSTDEVFETMALLSLPAREKTMKTLLALAYGEDRLKEFIVGRSLSMGNAEQLLRFEPWERAAILEIFSSMRVTESHVREILNLLSLTKIKKGQIDLESMRDFSSPEGLKIRLKRGTHPILTSLEEKLQQIRQQCGLPPGIDIKVDPFFEKEYIDISIRARNVQELEEGMEKIDRIVRLGYIRSILELTKG
jgi:ParB-like chromosome segregation protein Spo0J